MGTLSLGNEFTSLVCWLFKLDAYFVWMIGLGFELKVHTGHFLLKLTYDIIMTHSIILLCTKLDNSVLLTHLNGTAVKTRWIWSGWKQHEDKRRAFTWINKWWVLPVQIWSEISYKFGRIGIDKIFLRNKYLYYSSYCMYSIRFLFVCFHGYNLRSILDIMDQ